MPSTYTLIASATPSGTTSTTFSSIPSTYSDLKLVSSTRTTRSGANLDLLGYRFNGDGTASNHKYIRLSSDASSSSIPSSTIGNELVQYSTGATSTTNTFASSEIYIPNYTSTSSNKVFYTDSVTGQLNSTAFYQAIFANQWLSTAAITSITIYSTNAANFVSGSSFYLYGIKNS
jgi:hypothetical protein